MDIITNIIGSLKVFRDKPIQTLSDFTILVFIVIIFIISIFGFFVYCLWNNLITCNIMSISMLTISIVIYLYELLRFFSITKKRAPPVVKKVSEDAAKVEEKLKEVTEVSDGFRNFITNVNPEKICGVILFTVSYILSITASASSFSPGRDLDIKPFSIVKTIFIYILFIYSLLIFVFFQFRSLKKSDEKFSSLAPITIIKSALFFSSLKDTNEPPYFCIAEK